MLFGLLNDFWGGFLTACVIIFIFHLGIAIGRFGE